MVGFIVFCVFAFLTFMVISYFEVFYYVIKLIKEAFMTLLECVDIKKKNNTLQKRNLVKDKPLKNKNIINPIAKSKVENLRDRYPYADENLFNTLLLQYDSLPLYEIEKIEYNIAYSHYKKESSQKSGDIPKQHISNVLASKAFDTVFSFPITMKFYRIGCDYILSIEHDLTNECIMYQCRSHYTLLKLCNEIYENIAIKKSNNEQIVIMELFNLNKYSNLIKIS